MTKKTTEPMSLQKMFDTAAVGMLRQGKQSKSRTGKCAYRGDNGCKCAVGFLIPDELYDNDLEGIGIWELEHSDQYDALNTAKFRETLIQMRMTDSERLGLLGALQSCHDSAWGQQKPSFTRDLWHQELTRIARDFSLSTKSIDKVMDELKAR
jgi:hypothetical protein